MKHQPRNPSRPKPTRTWSSSILRRRAKSGSSPSSPNRATGCEKPESAARSSSSGVGSHPSMAEAKEKLHKLETHGGTPKEIAKAKALMKVALLRPGPRTLVQAFRSGRRKASTVSSSARAEGARHHGSGEPGCLRRGHTQRGIEHLAALRTARESVDHARMRSSSTISSSANTGSCTALAPSWCFREDSGPSTRCSKS